MEEDIDDIDDGIESTIRELVMSIEDQNKKLDQLENLLVDCFPSKPAWDPSPVKSPPRDVYRVLSPVAFTPRNRSPHLSKYPSPSPRSPGTPASGRKSRRSVSPPATPLSPFTVQRPPWNTRPMLDGNLSLCFKPEARTSTTYVSADQPVINAITYVPVQTWPENWEQSLRGLPPRRSSSRAGSKRAPSRKRSVSISMRRDAADRDRSRLTTSPRQSRSPAARRAPSSASKSLEERPRWVV
ncbi:hypothetical protein DIPPA_21292 [Diplonema papillatum]|nr:hypothetical protein DIPPA_21292 [Diplonema papillatum]